MKGLTLLKVFAMVFALIALPSMTFGCSSGDRVSPNEEKPSEYVWQQVTSKAAYPESYNYPVFVVGDTMVALNNGAWMSKEAKEWTKTTLPDSGLNSAYQKYVQFKDAIYALGTMQGNYLNMKLTSKISRTRDFKTWERMAERSNLPNRVFYGAAVFKDRIWLIGGWDGRRYYNDVWNSTDGVNWMRIAERTAWSPRNISKLFVFKGQLWFIGGGVIDGQKNGNPDSEKETWSSADGIAWAQVENRSQRKLAGAPIVFDDKLWLIGANRNDGNFSNAIWVSSDGKTWQEQSAPWSPRGGVAIWEFGEKLYMTGGKFSLTENGQIKFIYSNDVWVMSRKTE